jgi:hypothetical protein
MLTSQGPINNSMLNQSFMSNNSSGFIGQQNTGYATSREYQKPQLDAGLLQQPGVESQQQQNGTPTLNSNNN